MFDVASGTITLAEGRIEPSLTLRAFRGSRLGHDAEPGPGAEGWQSFVLRDQVGAGKRFVVTVRFDRERLAHVALCLVEESESAMWSDWSEKKERARKKRHDALLASELGGKGPWAYPWGSVESVYDPRAAASEILVVYR